MTAPDVTVNGPVEDEGSGSHLAWVSVDINMRDGSAFQADINMPDGEEEPTPDEIADGLYRCCLAAAYARGSDVVFALQQRMTTG